MASNNYIYKMSNAGGMSTIQRYTDMLAGNAAFVDLGDYESISTVTVGSGGSSTITFSSIPSTYKHLQIRGISKQSATTTGFPNIGLYFNADTTFTNYRSHYINANGSALGAGEVQAAGYYAYSFNTITSNAGYANMFGASVTDILDYANTNKNKTIRTLGGQDANGSGEVVFTSGLWMNSSTAVNAITLVLPGGGNFTQHSSFALYGIK
jgi:hypothetical protein